MREEGAKEREGGGDSGRYVSNEKKERRGWLSDRAGNEGERWGSLPRSRNRLRVYMSRSCIRTRLAESPPVILCLGACVTLLRQFVARERKIPSSDRVVDPPSSIAVSFRLLHRWDMWYSFRSIESLSCNDRSQNRKNKLVCLIIQGLAISLPNVIKFYFLNFIFEIYL